MPVWFKWNSVVALGLSFLFVFAKYNLVRLKMTPLRRDPCDAVGAFALIIVMLGSIISIVLAFRHYPKGSASVAQCVHAIRAQQAIALAVFITLAADSVALAKHPLMWITAVSRDKLLALLGTFAVVALAMELLVLAAKRTLPQTASTRWKRAVLAPTIGILLLVFCPEWPSDDISTTAHILTVVLGALVLFVPMRLLLTTLVPYTSDDGRSRMAFFGVREWGALLVGVLTGVFGFWADAHKVGGALALGIAGLFVAYAFFGEPLGLVLRANLDEGTDGQINRACS